MSAQKNQNMNLVLSTDAKPRLKWTPELHQRFVAAINQLGGPDKAKPKTLMRVLGIPGLTLYHLKSHLQKYRLGKSQQSHTGIEQKQEVSLDGDCGDSQSCEFQSSRGIESRDLQTDQSLEMQMEVQRKLHEQIEVQRHLQLRMEAQGKYIQSVLKKAQETLAGYNSSSIGIEQVKSELSQLLSMVGNGYPSSPISDLTETGDENATNAVRNGWNGATRCSLESSLASTESSISSEPMSKRRRLIAAFDLNKQYNHDLESDSKGIDLNRKETDNLHYNVISNSEAIDSQEVLQ